MVSEIPDRRCSDVSQDKIVRMKDDTGIISSGLICLQALRHSNTGPHVEQLSLATNQTTENYSGHPFFLLSQDQEEENKKCSRNKIYIFLKLSIKTRFGLSFKILGSNPFLFQSDSPVIYGPV